MTLAIQPIGRIQQALAEAKTPEQSKEVEAMAAAAQAWAKEQRNYEVLVRSTHAYILARRKTTELTAPSIHHGDHGRGTLRVPRLADFGFTKKQWARRLLELEIEAPNINHYFDECIKNGWEPSLFDFVRRYGPAAGAAEQTWQDRLLALGRSAERSIVDVPPSKRKIYQRAVNAFVQEIAEIAK